MSDTNSNNSNNISDSKTKISVKDIFSQLNTEPMNGAQITEGYDWLKDIEGKTILKKDKKK